MTSYVNQKLETRLRRHANLILDLLCAFAFKDALGATAHRGAGGADELVRVDDDVDAGGGELAFRDLRIGGGHDHERLVGGDLRAETFGK